VKITNPDGLPAAIVEAVTNDPYSKGDADFSATKLLKPPQMAGLMRRHWDELEESATDRIWALLGQSVHAILERSDRAMSEERLYVDVLGFKVGAKFDTLDVRCRKLSDYKVTSAWTRVFGSQLDEWNKQLNIYAYVLRSNGYEVESAEIVAIYRDWSRTQADRSPRDYPQAPVEAIPMRLDDADAQRLFIEGRVRLHAAARNGEWPPCTDDERWHKADTWAVMKHGRKSAVKLFDDKAAAEDYFDANQDGTLYLDLRRGQDTRCESYCPVVSFCNQAKANLVNA